MLKNHVSPSPIPKKPPRPDDGTGPRGGTTAAAGGKLGPQQPGARYLRVAHAWLGHSPENMGKHGNISLKNIENRDFTGKIDLKWRFELGFSLENMGNSITDRGV